MAGAVVVAGLATLSTSAAAADHPIRGAGSRSAIAGSYIVMLKDSASLRGKGLESRAAALASSHHGTLGAAWTALHGFSVHMSAADAEKLAAEPDVDFVQQDQRRASAGIDTAGRSGAGPRATPASAKPGQVTTSVALADMRTSLNVTPNAAQTPVSWALDRIDQHALPLDNRYAYDDTAGQGVTAYMLGTGISIAHPDFGGRAFYGPNFVDDGRTNLGVSLTLPHIVDLE